MPQIIWGIYGAGYEIRTRFSSLEGWCTTHMPTPLICGADRGTTRDYLRRPARLGG